jgi:hypothetical protein
MHPDARRDPVLTLALAASGFRQQADAQARPACSRCRRCGRRGRRLWCRHPCTCVFVCCDGTDGRPGQLLLDVKAAFTTAVRLPAPAPLCPGPNPCRSWRTSASSCSACSALATGAGSPRTLWCESPPRAYWPAAGACCSRTSTGARMRRACCWWCASSVSAAWSRAAAPRAASAGAARSRPLFLQGLSETLVLQAGRVCGAAAGRRGMHGGATG